MAKKQERKPYLVFATKTGRAVIFGYSATEPQPGGPYRLEDARMILRVDRVGFHGLASRGPAGDTRITMSVPVDSGDRCAQVLHVAPAAAEAIEGWEAWS